MTSLTLFAAPFDRRGHRAEARLARRTSAPTAVAVSVLLALALVPAAARTQPTRTPDVHFVPTPMDVVDSMLAVARVTKDDRLYDLGSGDGRIVITAAKRFGTRGIGIDIDPQRIADSRRNADTARVTQLVEFRQADLFETDLRDATVVTLYLLPRLNVKLRPKLFAELRPGTRVVSHAFDMGDWPADSVVYVGGRTVHFWVIPSNVQGTWTVTAPAGGVDRTYELRLEQNYQRLTGSATSGGRAMSVEGARVVGDSVMFTLIGVAGGSTLPGEQRMRFAGRLNADAMTGAVTGTAAGNAGQWRATRRPNR
jgi:SAM-dependent methyltransferase